MTLPLEGIKILDLSRILTGPYCTMMLADMGAEVIKVEVPGTGDDTRQWGPPFVNGESAYFLSINRNKKSITLNLKSLHGKEILHRLVKQSDVLVENFRPGTMEKLGIGYDKLKEINPRLIYCSISGFGQDGPSRDKPGYDVLAQAMGGLMSCTGEPGGPPVKAGFAIADIGAGMWAAFGILAALMAREKTGLGQAVDTSLLEAQVSWHTYMAGNFFASGKNPRKLGSAHPNIVPYQAFSGKDQYFIVAVGNDSLWQKFCQVTGLEHLASDSRFATNPKRVENRDELVGIIQERLLTRSAAEWVEALESAGIPAGPINNFDQVYKDPQVLYRKMMVEAEHLVAGNIRMTGIPVKLSETPGQIRTVPPLLGQNTDEVLLSLGYSSEQIVGFRSSGTL